MYWCEWGENREERISFPETRHSPAITLLKHRKKKKKKKKTKMTRKEKIHKKERKREITKPQGCIFRLTCSYPELTEDHVLTSAYVKIFRTVTRNAVNKGV